MTACNLRSLLVAAIVLSHCITWTASRHHFPHNVHGHRSRHRRQGTGLFLSANYVIPGGEGAGWGEWKDDSPCSRTCGGGVASQKRICLQTGPDGQLLCRGGDTKYFSCQTQDCPSDSTDFRAEQCAEFNDKDFRGFKYNWVPYTKAPNPCELNCMPHGERFYYRHKPKVIDGTRCYEDSFDVCVDGVCQPVGCDMMLGSNAREDKCRQCRGNGTNCHTTGGLIDTQDLIKGYNDILLIPAGSTTIIIEEIAPSNNYLAIRNKNGTYYLNGHYHIDFPRSMVIAGAVWVYERSQAGYPAPDKLKCSGPTIEPLYLALLLQDDNVGVQYEYSVPTNLAPYTDKQYNWVNEMFEPCSASCGGGFQTRNVTCRSKEELEVVDDSLCDEGLKPVVNQTCNNNPCPAEWVEGPWSECSKRCGKGGVRSREVTCQKIIANGNPSIVADKECFDLYGPKPELFQECNKDAICPSWFVGRWKPCDKLCDEGKQTRQVVCRQETNGRVEVLDDQDCEDEKPTIEQTCLTRPCEGLDWITTEWSGCDTCLSTVRTRTALCVSKEQRAYNDSFCAHHKGGRPPTEESCDKDKLPPCEVQWYATQWSKCSVECGEGVQTRAVFCGLYDGETVVKVKEEKCADQPKYNDTKPCEVPEDKCPSQWYAGPWTTCSDLCGGGEQFRRVMCLRGNKTATDCAALSVPDSTQNCNPQACDADELIPVSSSTTITDEEDYPECEDDEESYSEVGLDVDSGTGTTLDLMFSDGTSSGFAEHESTLTTEEGSGDGSTLSTEELISIEGSGFSSLSTNDYSTEDTDSTVTEETDTTSATDSSSDSGSTLTDETADTSESSPSESSVSDESTTPSGSDSTDGNTSTDNTGSTEVTEPGLTPKDLTTRSPPDFTTTSDSSDATDGETTDTAVTESTDSTVTESTDTEDTSGTGTEETGLTETTGTSESESTNTDETETTDVSSTPASSESSESTTEEGSTTESSVSSTDTSDSTIESSTSSGSTVEEESTTSDVSSTPASSESSESTTEGGSTTESGASSTDASESTVESSTSSESTDESSTVAGSESTTESGSTVSTDGSSTSGSESTEFSSESSTTESGSSTIESSTLFGESTETTESSGSESTTEFGSSIVSGDTETDVTSTGETGSTEESSSTSESDTESSSSGYSTTESTDFTEGSTIEGLTTEGVSVYTDRTPWTFETTVHSKPKVCKPRRKKCTQSAFGCCPDKKTAAAGPFDEGCPTPRTCKETRFGCCADGVSPAKGEKEKGCPVTPCEDTLFGCCQSDNKTEAKGNDQEGCPPPPPACTSSKYGCCADEETEATGPDAAGCPESEIETTTASETSESSTNIEGSTSEGSTESDSSTEVESSTIAGASTTSGDCAESEFGCCHDNNTASPGPDGQGCPCNATEFGCCPDGVSPARGNESKGCPGPCKESAHGCCPDNETPAHGPDFEGCCLLTAFGCCPDNRKPAEGPHLEGCGCQHTQFGCCPDKVTIALGTNNEGCGCQYTTFGCCPDRHTPANGREFEGCSCHTYQFGCCPDGVTTAKGPEQQGCHCRQSTYGCCGDDQTPATGPDGAGCDCGASKYGCCPDGRTDATGPKFLGCSDAPENKQAVCSLSTDPGPCHNFTAMWFYDLTYGGCSRFWYGSCEGNGNKFATKEECEDICVQPSPKDACKLPGVRGPCDADHVRWYFNSTREQCAPFRYGGCLGNANNFDTRELCQTQCEPSRAEDTCSLPIEQGSCAGNFSSWGYNKESRSCEQFIWGGCEGNSNRFKTEAACQARCAPPGALKPECSEPQEAGNCSSKEALWSFSQSENRCVPFYYTGCGGNGNRFDSRETCEQICPSAYVPDKCTLPAETGECSTYREKWFYDTAIQRCRQFYYGGCGGNENNFGTEAECENTCSEIALTTTTTTTVRPPQPNQRPQPDSRPESDRESFCFFEIDVGGRCSASEQTRYAYDSALGKCVTFQYLGCGGNQNNFPTEEHCIYYCHPVQDICQLPMLSGPCDASDMQWFYDASTDTCSEFTYGGCEGNANRFASREACEARCRSGEQPTQRTAVTTTTSTTVVIDNRIGEQIPPECRISPELEECTAVGEVWYFDPNQHECVSYINQGAAGRNCKHTATFATQEGCERSCGAFRGVDVCSQRVDPGPCRAFIPKIYFDQESGTCKQFGYGGCLGGANRFSSVEECSQVCKTATDVCSLPPEQGDCNAYIKQWYYDTYHGACNQFVYTGCGGNDNRFETREDCESRCTHAAGTTTTLAPAVRGDVSEECTTPSSLAPCGRNLTVYYFETSSRRCLPSEFGYCGHANSYRSEEECERQCGAFRGIDVCQARLDTGTCRTPVRKFYFDTVTGICQVFTYSGCEGGPNRFSSLEECEELCGNSGPAPGCLQEADTGYAARCPAPSVPRYHYSTSRGDCVVFVYQGCGGNDNNFLTYDQCRQYCIPSVRNEVDCERYNRECDALDCAYGVVRSSAPGGCESCACADVTSHCEMLQQECDALVCPYGIYKVPDDGCEICVCHEDPCSAAKCGATERCVADAYVDPLTREPKYTARCIADEDNEVIPDCSSFEAECKRLNCEFGVQHIRTANGCQRCECVPVEINCEPLKEECERLKCTYGVEKSRGTDGCERCKCTEHPCATQSCPAGERCVVNTYRDVIAQEPRYSAECRTVVKPGECPSDDSISNEVTCRHECNDDADCRGVSKCCRRGCSEVCEAPADTASNNILTTTYAPDIPAAPVAVPQPEPQVAAAEGGKATLRCLFHGNPPPKITWRRGELTIDGNVGRYRLLSDGALEIVSLYRNDTGVYICVADNGLGTATQEINLVVNDPEITPVEIAGDENAVITGELNKPLVVRCLAYGSPPPGIYWDHDGYMVAFNDDLYETRSNALLIRNLSIETLGQYTCQAYNGVGKAASWVVSVRAYKPEGIFLEHEYLVPRKSLPTTTRVQLPTTRETTSTPTTTTTERPVFTVPVSTAVSTPFSTLNIGSELRLECEVDGYPEPTVHWTKNDVRIVPDDRVSVTGSTVVSRLVIPRVEVSDSGLYGCHANNGYTSHTDNAQINVQQLTVPAKCTDNPFFANCDLIVRSKFCTHKYYSKFCCKSCVEAGQLDPQVAEMQADQPYRKK